MKLHRLYGILWTENKLTILAMRPLLSVWTSLKWPSCKQPLGAVRCSKTTWFRVRKQKNEKVMKWWMDEFCFLLNQTISYNQPPTIKMDGTQIFDMSITCPVHRVIFYVATRVLRVSVRRVTCTCCQRTNMLASPMIAAENFEMLTPV